MKGAFLKIINYGIKPEFSSEEIEQTKLVNGISFLGVPICLTYSIIFLLTGYYNYVALFLTGVLIFSAPIFFNKWFGVKIGRVFIVLMAPIFFGVSSVLLGKDTGFYLGFLVVSVPPILVFPSAKNGIFFTTTSIVILILSIIGNMNIKPLSEIPFAMPLYLLNLFTVLICTIAVVYLFKKELSESNAIVLEKNKEITDSINYAKKIQYALLAHNDLLKSNLPEYFVLFKPKDIVSGDFYWATKKNNFFYFAICDSTGHGVPGAFMSLLNISFLNEAITEKNITEPDKIFNHVREQLIKNVSQEGAQDGMDGVLIQIEKTPNTLNVKYASANNAPILISDNKINVLPYDKMPVGKGEKLDPFNLFSIELKKGDSLYLYTDGYADQFGGPKGKKYKYKNLDDLLLSIHIQPSKEQSKILDQNFMNWKGKLEQVDDICIVGIKV